jgi:diacylglycerol kinase family enzyme/membrane-associated phospholipid phosphatase
MVRKRPSAASLAITAFLVAVMGGWTAVVLTTDLTVGLDNAVARPPVPLTSGIGQIASAVSLITQPVLIYLSLLVFAAIAYRNRMRNLAGALVLMAVLGQGGGWLLKVLIRRPRPADALDLISTHGYAYPSGHLTAATIGVIAVTAVLVVTRRRRVAQWRWALIGAAIVVVVAIDRLILAAHRLTDLIGGLFYGGAIAALALVIAGVSVLPPFTPPGPRARIARTARRASALNDSETEPMRCAVIYNPARIGDWVGFRRAVEYEVRNRGWRPALWFETTIEDPGREMTRRAISGGADLVIAAGGDGTVRVVAAEVAGTGIPFAVIPAGTGNLLAKNLAIPLDERAAIEVAFGGRTRSIDVVEVTVDDDRKDHFLVMAGVGIDAAIMQETNVDLKKAVGSAAYFVAAARNANHPPVHVTISVDDGPPFRRRTHLVVLGNVGYLQGGIPLIPDAKPDDGKLDVLIASPRRPSDWPKLVAHVVTRRRGDLEEIERTTCTKIKIEVAEGDHFELDGDPAGHCFTMAAEILPHALNIRVPR